MGEEARIALAFATPAMRRKGWFAGMAGAGQARHFPVRLTCRIHLPVDCACLSFSAALQPSDN
jgi:hypothetical protein